MPGQAATHERPADRLYRAALGEASAGRYLPVFARFDAQGTAGPAWNSAAAALNLGWMVHHRLWYPLALCSALFAALALLVAGLWQLAPGWPMGVKLGGSLALLLCVLMVPGLWGSAWLHDRLRQRVMGAVARAATLEAACDALQAEAGERQRRNTWVLAACLSAGVFGGLLWKTVPWASLLDREALTEASSAPPLPAEAASNSLGAKASAANAVPPVSLHQDELKNTETDAEGLPVLDGAHEAVSVAGSPAKPGSLTVTQPETLQAPSVDEPAVAPAEPAQAVALVLPAAEKATQRSAAAPKPEATSTKARVVGTSRSTDASAVAKARPATRAAATAGLVDSRTRVKGFGVAVGMFAVTTNAERVVATLKKAGLPVIRDSVASARGDLTRIRVGPFDQLAQAEATAVKVKALGLEAKVYAP